MASKYKQGRNEVTQHGTDRPTRRDMSMWDKQVASTEQGAQQGCADGLTYLKGAVTGDGTFDMDVKNNDMYAPMGAVSSDDWRDNYRKKRNLLRHTVEQGGLSTWCKDEFF